MRTWTITAVFTDGTRIRWTREVESLAVRPARSDCKRAWLQQAPDTFSHVDVTWEGGSEFYRHDLNSPQSIDGALSI